MHAKLSLPAAAILLCLQAIFCGQLATVAQLQRWLNLHARAVSLIHMGR